MILEKWWARRRPSHRFSKIIGGGGTGSADDAALGRGLWRRAYADCATAAGDDPELAALLPFVLDLAQEAQRRWPTDSLDVPADPDGRATFDRLRSLRRALREADYRTRLAATGQGGPEQQRLREQALRTARGLTGAG